jgi:hypothetical protein
VEFPLSGVQVTGADFQLESGKLIFRGQHPRHFNVRASLNLARLLLQNSDLDPAVITINNLAFAIGLNGEAVNTVQMFNKLYADSRFNFKWLATQVTQNNLNIHPGDAVSLLLYTPSSIYINVPPNIGVNIPNKTPPAGSVYEITASASLVFQAQPNAFAASRTSFVLPHEAKTFDSQITAVASFAEPQPAKNLRERKPERKPAAQRQVAPPSWVRPQEIRSAMPMTPCARPQEAKIAKRERTGLAAMAASLVEAHNDAPSRVVAGLVLVIAGVLFLFLLFVILLLLGLLLRRQL